ncbi:hypothetical protein B0T10DRAFT_143296 [Thelonectria olida]|uniref:DUF7896 domain-containing protein n=1 Tax=Thelonectria olida TaxID=1576542 RepID=A0A9P8VYP1_9HYPO|nr:hypothetical protein B0T10DRAFT_143296 [Thelonectria olida]
MKLSCDQCSEHPEGFRGDHELRRHVLAKHEGLSIKFICRDPATAGLVSPLQPTTPLSKCKACVEGRQYGAWYNAAAHLRRVHFRPKKSRGKNNNVDADEQKQSDEDVKWGDLKIWFEEKLVPIDEKESGHGLLREMVE